MRHTVLLCAALFVACAPADNKTPAMNPAASTPAAAMSMISLADVAGAWDGKSMPMDKDSVLTTWRLTATGDMNGWSLKFANGTVVPTRVLSVAGDSVVTEAGPYASVLRAGVQVTTQMVLRMKDGKLAGTFFAHYASTPPDSLRGRSEATRAGGS